MTLTTGNQLKAARALAGVDQQQVADSAMVNVNTIRNMEARGAKPITSSAVTIRRVQLALEALGIEFLNHTQPGVRLSIQTDRTAEWRDRKPRRKKVRGQTDEANLGLGRRPPGQRRSK
jgi:transcriptional regulator with XRE-family HTH domain